MAGCGGGIDKRLSHHSPENIRVSLKNIHDNPRDIRDGPDDTRDGFKNIRDNFKNIHDSPPENPRQSEEEWIEAQPPSRPLPAL